MKALRISRSELHHIAYLSGLAMLVCGLPLSRTIVTISLCWLAANWIAEGQFVRKLTIIRKNPSILLFASLFLVYATGLLTSEDSTEALNKVRNALPLLLMPLVIGTSNSLTARQLRQLLLLFSAAVTIAAVASLAPYLSAGDSGINNQTEVTLFMSHIRFSLLVNMAFGILTYYLLRPDELPVPGSNDLAGPRYLYDSDRQPATRGRKKWIAMPVYALWAGGLAAYLFFLRSVTGLAIMVFLVILTAFWLSFRIKNPLWRLAPLAFILLTLAAAFVSILSMWSENFTAATPDHDMLPAKTANGNPYEHQTGNLVLENGNYIDLYVCEKEMETEWNNLSRLRYDGPDLKGQELRYTLRRYLTSKNLRKDSAGIHLLTMQDIKAVENGMTNYRFTESSLLYQRLYESLWELHVYFKTGYAKNHSLAQRLAFIATACKLIRRNPLFGIGPGDVGNHMVRQAQEDKVLIEERWEGKIHNQFLFFLTAFGLAGFCWVLLAWTLPVLQAGKYINYQFAVFISVSALSMFSMDMLESFDSIVFFAFFYSLFAFGRNETLPGQKTGSASFT